MPIKNYTTKVPVEQTMGRIQGLLARAGANRIAIEYGRQREPSGIEFSIMTAHGERTYMLPARIDGIHKALQEDPRVDLRYTTRRHAAAVGWRLVEDWLSAQVAFLEAEMHTLEEIMMAWLLVDRERSRSLYDVMVEHQMALPAAGSRLK